MIGVWNLGEVVLDEEGGIPEFYHALTKLVFEMFKTLFFRGPTELGILYVGGRFPISYPWYFCFYLCVRIGQGWEVVLTNV